MILRCFKCPNPNIIVPNDLIIENVQSIRFSVNEFGMMSPQETKIGRRGVIVCPECGNMVGVALPKFHIWDGNNAWEFILDETYSIPMLRQNLIGDQIALLKYLYPSMAEEPTEKPVKKPRKKKVKK